jgi:hypothetical protein
VPRYALVEMIRRTAAVGMPTLLASSGDQLHLTSGATQLEDAKWCASLPLASELDGTTFSDKGVLEAKLDQGT